LVIGFGAIGFEPIAGFFLGKQLRAYYYCSKYKKTLNTPHLLLIITCHMRNWYRLLILLGLPTMADISFLY
jgi:hypothetical protein